MGIKKLGVGALGQRPHAELGEVPEENAVLRRAERAA
jgi:hypothetical protein